MNHSLQQRIHKLGSLERHLKPDEGWVRATREHLLAEMRASLPTEPVSSTKRAREFVKYFLPSRLLSWLRGPLMATVSILLVALGGSVASVSAAENSLPGDLLYSLKLATEQARLALTPSHDEKLKLKLEFNARRGQELKKVAHDQSSADKQDRVERATDILKRDLKTVKEQLKEVKSQDASDAVARLAKLVDQGSQELVQVLQETKSDLSTEGKEKVTEAQAAAADTGVTAIEMLAEKHQESDAIVAKKEVIQAIQDHARTVAEITGTTLSASASSSLDELATSGTAPIPAPLLEQAVKEVKLATEQAFAVSSTLPIPSGASSTLILPPVQEKSENGGGVSSTTTTTSSIDIPAPSSTSSSSP